MGRKQGTLQSVYFLRCSLLCVSSSTVLSLSGCSFTPRSCELVSSAASSSSELCWVFSDEEIFVLCGCLRSAHRQAC